MLLARVVGTVVATGEVVAFAGEGYFEGNGAMGREIWHSDGTLAGTSMLKNIGPAAADGGFRLYLAGHTHGGQVCLPGGRPIITHMSRHRRYARGLWRHGAMVGYTSTGLGVSALPVRFNSRGEVVMITLRSGQAPRRPWPV